jgi:hypothetical protein
MRRRWNRREDASTRYATTPNKTHSICSDGEDRNTAPSKGASASVRNIEGDAISSRLDWNKYKIWDTAVKVVFI